MSSNVVSRRSLAVRPATRSCTAFSILTVLSKFLYELAYIWAERGYTGAPSSAHLLNS